MRALRSYSDDELRPDDPSFFDASVHRGLSCIFLMMYVLYLPNAVMASLGSCTLHSSIPETNNIDPREID